MRAVSLELSQVAGFCGSALGQGPISKWRFAA
jgi:hypothetical protein